MDGEPHFNPSPEESSLREEAQKSESEASRKVSKGMIIKDVLPHLFGSQKTQDTAPQHMPDENRSEFTQDFLGQITQTLVQSIIANEFDEAQNLINEVHFRGLDRARILTDILSPAAAKFGDLWLNDDLSFTDVTMGMGCLTGLMRGICCTDASNFSSMPLKNALILSNHDGDHRFGPQMFCELLRMNGWSTRHVIVEADDEAADIIASTPVSFIGLSIDRELDIPKWRTRLKTLREHASNPNLKIIAGGPGLANIKEPLDSLGFDAAFQDGPSTLTYLENLYQKQLLSPA